MWEVKMRRWVDDWKKWERTDGLEWSAGWNRKERLVIVEDNNVIGKG
jgi:hypothetical protein